MRIAVIGTGAAGRTVASALAKGGHDVVVGTRSPEATAAREDWQAVGVPLVPLGEAAAGADLVVNLTNGNASVEALRQVGPSLDGVVILDVANPLDLSRGFPPTLSVKDTDSLAEQIQRTILRPGHFLGECKWTSSPIDMDVLMALQAKARKLTLDDSPLWVLASRSGFRPALHRRAEEGNLLLLTPADLY